MSKMVFITAEIGNEGCFSLLNSLRSCWLVLRDPDDAISDDVEPW